MEEKGPTVALTPRVGDTEAVELELVVVATVEDVEVFEVVATDDVEVVVGLVEVEDVVGTVDVDVV